jgi:hypothetical protein
MATLTGSSADTKTNAEPTLAQLAAEPSAAFEGEGWKTIFEGKDLKGWNITDFAGSGPVKCEDGLVTFQEGDSLTGINFTNEVPKTNYEVALDALKLQGSDFFCGLTFPVGDSFATLIVGGWGGTVTGISSVDDADASENETTGFKKYELDKWYRVRVRVTAKKIEAWVDGEKMVDLMTKDKKIDLRFGEIENSKPLGIAAYQTRAALRDIRIRRLDDAGK